MIDGNKRFAMTVAEVFLKKNGFVLELSTEEYVSIALKIADNRTRPSLQEVCEWVKSKIRPKSVQLM